jgi:hypothetical protein
MTVDTAIRALNWFLGIVVVLATFALLMGHWA